MDIITENVHNVNIAKGINEHFSMCGDRWRRGKDGWWAVVKEGVKIGGSGEMQGKAGLDKGLGKMGVVREGEKKGVGGDKRGRKMGREGAGVVVG